MERLVIVGGINIKRSAMNGYSYRLMIRKNEGNHSLYVACSRVRKLDSLYLHSQRDKKYYYIPTSIVHLCIIES